jgi:hypothetical protein
VQGGFEPLLAAAAARLPGNKVFAPFASTRTRRLATISAPLHSFTDQFDVFLSFSSKDRNEVKSIAERLTRHGVRPWLDEWALALGKQFADEIQAILARVDAVAVFCGTEGFGPWQKLEMNVAIDRAARGECLLIPVMLPGVKSEDLPPFLRTMHGLRINDALPVGDDVDNAEAVKKLAEVILKQRRRHI